MATPTFRVRPLAEPDYPRYVEIANAVLPDLRSTVAFARARGYREIPTRNNTRNRPMLRINEAMGFAKQPAWVVSQKLLDSPR